MQTLATRERPTIFATPERSSRLDAPEMQREITLHDGKRLVVRVGTAEDLAAVQELHARCSAATRASRYHAGKPTLSASEWRYFTNVSRSTTLVVAPAGEPDLLVALVHLVRTQVPGQVELAVLIDDEWQSRRAGTALIGYAVDLARGLGFTSMLAVVQSTNHRALAVLQRLSATVVHRSGAVLDLVIQLSPQPPARRGSTS